MYITVKQSPYYSQMTIEDFLFGDVSSICINKNETNTKTYKTNEITDKMLKRISLSGGSSDIYGMVCELTKFNDMFADLRAVEDRHSLYREFYIPKRSGGLRKIDAPNDELMNALRVLKTILEKKCCALYHTSAFAYVKERSTVDAVKRHQANNSKWVAKYDLSNFFGSTTLEFVMDMLSKIYPFSEIINPTKTGREDKLWENLVTGELMNGKEELRKALELGFLDGGLPQGTPLSPTLTNIMMIPVDFELSNALRYVKNETFVYTRYADDFQISSRYDFSFKEIEKMITKTLKDFNAPFKINSKKTKYGSTSGANWMLGVMLNKDNDITVGHKRKKNLQNALVAYIKDHKNGIMWSQEDLASVKGDHSYCRMVEGETIDRIIKYINDKFNVDVLKMIHDDLALCR